MLKQEKPLIYLTLVCALGLAFVMFYIKQDAVTHNHQQHSDNPALYQSISQKNDVTETIGQPVSDLKPEALEETPDNSEPKPELPPAEAEIEPTIAGRFNTEKIDINWAEERQLAILQIMQAFSQSHPDLFLDHVECKSSICRLDLLSYDENNQIDYQTMEGLVEALPWSGEVMVITDHQERITKAYVTDGARLDQPTETGLVLSFASEQGRYVVVYHSAPFRNPANCSSGGSESRYVVDLDYKKPGGGKAILAVIKKAHSDQEEIKLKIDRETCWRGSAIIAAVIPTFNAN